MLGATSPKEMIGAGHVAIGVRGGALVEQVAGADSRHGIPDACVCIGLNAFMKASPS